jgi:hypothetical protein
MRLEHSTADTWSPASPGPVKLANFFEIILFYFS